MQSHPLRVRGLKLHITQDGYIFSPVAPLAGCGLKHFSKRLEFFRDDVAPLAGAWIEGREEYKYTTVGPELIRALDRSQRIVFTQLSFRFNSVSTSELIYLIVPFELK